jgi:hypothetical protein
VPLCVNGTWQPTRNIACVSGIGTAEKADVALSATVYALFHQYLSLRILKNDRDADSDTEFNNRDASCFICDAGDVNCQATRLIDLNIATTAAIDAAKRSPMLLLLSITIGSAVVSLCASAKVSVSSEMNLNDATDALLTIVNSEALLFLTHTLALWLHGLGNRQSREITDF